MILGIPEKRVDWPNSDPRRTTRYSQNGRFVKGPLPLIWLTTASRLPGRALSVGIACWYLSGLTKSKNVRLSNVIAKQFGVSKDSKARALRVLEKAGLVRVTQTPGRAAMVEILNLKDRN